MSEDFTHIPDLSAHMEIPEDGILSRTVHDDARVRVVLFGFAAGEKLTEHTASEPAVLHFLRGEATLTLGEERVEARAGTWVHMPAELPHSLHATAPVLMLLTLLK